MFTRRGVRVCYESPGVFPLESVPCPPSTGSEVRSPSKTPVTQTILIVDDDETVLHMAAMILQTLGFTVLVAHNGSEGLQMFLQYPSVIHLIITDIVMPRMSGRQLANRINSFFPNQRILFMSEYSVHSIYPAHSIDEGWGVIRSGSFVTVDDILRKPFSSLDLEARVRERLGTSALQSPSP